MTSTWRAGFALASFLPARYVLGGLGWAANHSLPFVSGLALKAVFDAVGDGRVESTSTLALVAVFAAVEVLRAGLFFVSIAVWPAWWNSICTLLRLNLLASLLHDRQPPAERLPGSSSASVARFREDVLDVVWFVDVWVDVFGGLVFAAAALAVMASIDLSVTLVVVVPMVAVVVATRALGRRIRKWHDETRQSGARVSALVGDAFANVLALKASGAEPALLARLRTENGERATNAVRAEVAGNLIPTTSEAAVDLAVGLVLLLAAPAARAGEFTVGDLALFTTYAAWLTGLPRWTGRMLARRREATVALGRMAELLPGRRVADLVAHRPVYLQGTPPPPPAVHRAPAEAFRRLEVRGLTVEHARSGRGVRDVDLDLRPGTVTVVTGAIGSGKSTLLRGILGLLSSGSGEIRWNGVAVADPGRHLVPPRVAYVPQVPRLFSASLRENVLLGWPAGDHDLDEAMELAVLDADLADFPAGLATLVGPHGVRLSGGQVQRASIARAVVRRPELLVVDDVSSALDVETERRLWAGLVGTTALVVSHRRAALELADQVVVLDRGRVADVGSLEQLLRTSQELKRLWHGELLSEREEAIGA